MGLDTTHGAWHGPYSSFGRFRDKLAEMRGFRLRDMIGFGGRAEWTDEQKNDPLYPLLNHSDCDGELSPKECANVALGLSQILISENGSDKNFFEDVRQFRDGCIAAFTKNESIEFH